MDHQCTQALRIEGIEKLNESMTQKIDKISDKVSGIEVAIAALPEKITEKTDERYASKQTENDLKELNAKLESRNWEWLRYIVMTILGALLAYIVGNIK